MGTRLQITGPNLKTTIDNRILSKLSSNLSDSQVTDVGGNKSVCRQTVLCTGDIGLMPNNSRLTDIGELNA